MHTAKQHTWQALEALSTATPTLTELFATNAKRGQEYTISACQMYLDFSKQLIDEQVLQHLLQLAYDCALPQAITALLGGEMVNDTENRPALHTALRAPKAVSYTHLTLPTSDLV